MCRFCCCCCTRVGCVQNWGREGGLRGVTAPLLAGAYTHMGPLGSIIGSNAAYRLRTRRRRHASPPPPDSPTAYDNLLLACVTVMDDGLMRRHTWKTPAWKLHRGKTWMKPIVALRPFMIEVPFMVLQRSAAESWPLPAYLCLLPHPMRQPLAIGLCLSSRCVRCRVGRDGKGEKGLPRRSQHTLGRIVLTITIMKSKTFGENLYADWVSHAKAICP